MPRHPTKSPRRILQVRRGSFAPALVLVRRWRGTFLALPVAGLPMGGRCGCLQADDGENRPNRAETLVLQVVGRRQRFIDRGSARRALFDYIEGWYNPHRRHWALGYLSPAEFERRWQEQSVVA